MHKVLRVQNVNSAEVETSSKWVTKIRTKKRNLHLQRTYDVPSYLKYFYLKEMLFT